MAATTAGVRHPPILMPSVDKDASLTYPHSFGTDTKRNRNRFLVGGLLRRVLPLNLRYMYICVRPGSPLPAPPGNGHAHPPSGVGGCGRPPPCGVRVGLRGPESDREREREREGESGREGEKVEREREQVHLRACQRVQREARERQRERRKRKRRSKRERQKEGERERRSKTSGWLSGGLHPGGFEPLKKQKKLKKSLRKESAATPKYLGPYHGMGEGPETWDLAHAKIYIYDPPAPL